jgi:excinuclease UvrABC nuclease subunit
MLLYWPTEASLLVLLDGDEYSVNIASSSIQKVSMNVIEMVTVRKAKRHKCYTTEMVPPDWHSFSSVV